MKQKKKKKLNPPLLIHFILTIPFAPIPSPSPLLQGHRRRFKVDEGLDGLPQKTRHLRHHCRVSLQGTSQQPRGCHSQCHVNTEQTSGSGGPFHPSGTRCNPEGWLFNPEAWTSIPEDQNLKFGLLWELFQGNGAFWQYLSAIQVKWHVPLLFRYRVLSSSVL